MSGCERAYCHAAAHGLDVFEAEARNERKSEHGSQKAGGDE